MSAINEDCEFDTCRSAVIENGIERSPNGPAGKNDIINQNHARAINGKFNLTPLQLRVFMEMLEVIAIERNIEHSETNIRAFFTKSCCDTLRDFITTTPNPYEINRL